MSIHGDSETTDERRSYTVLTMTPNTCLSSSAAFIEYYKKNRRNSQLEHQKRETERMFPVSVLAVSFLLLWSFAHIPVPITCLSFFTVAPSAHVSVCSLSWKAHAECKKQSAGTLEEGVNQNNKTRKHFAFCSLSFPLLKCLMGYLHLWFVATHWTKCSLNRNQGTKRFQNVFETSLFKKDSLVWGGWCGSVKIMFSV